jgi:hypothetical protein
LIIFNYFNLMAKQTKPEATPAAVPKVKKAGIKKQKSKRGKKVAKPRDKSTRLAPKENKGSVRFLG